jgi:hypothetical protein
MAPASTPPGSKRPSPPVPAFGVKSSISDPQPSVTASKSPMTILDLKTES